VFLKHQAQKFALPNTSRVHKLGRIDSYFAPLSSISPISMDLDTTMSPIGTAQAETDNPTEIPLPPSSPIPETIDRPNPTPKTIFGSSKTYQDISAKLQTLRQHCKGQIRSLARAQVSTIANEEYILKLQGQIDPIISQCHQLKAILLDPYAGVNGQFRQDIIELIGGSDCVVAKEWWKLLSEWREYGLDHIIEDERIWVTDEQVWRAMKIVEYWIASLIHPLGDIEARLEAGEKESEFGKAATALLRELRDWEEAIKGG
jgi:hypothetical protein